MVTAEEKKRIALFLPSLAGGGAQRVIVNLAAGFVGQGYPVDLVLSKARGPYLNAVDPRVRIVNLKVARVIFSLPALVRYLRREKPVAVISALPRANLVAVWAKLLVGGNTRVIVSEHTTVKVGRTKTARKWLTGLLRKFYLSADEIVAVSAGVADSLVKRANLPKERITVIYNPVVVPELFIKAQEKPDHPWFGEDCPIILGVGRLTPSKDFATLIRAFYQVRQKVVARLVIVGDGEVRDRLEALVRELGLEKWVWLAGFTDNPYGYMSGCDVFVLPSLIEGLPTVLIEALACGCKVVSTDCESGPREILKQGRYGRLVPMGDTEAMAAALLDILQGETHESWQECAGEYGVEKIVGEYLALIKGH